MQQMPNAKALSHGRDTTIDVLGRQPYVFGREGELVGDVRVEILGFRVLEHAADQQGEPVDRHGLHIQPRVVWLPANAPWKNEDGPLATRV